MYDFCPDAGLHVLKSAVQRAAHAGAFALTIGGDHSVAAAHTASLYSALHGALHSSQASIGTVHLHGALHRCHVHACALLHAGEHSRHRCGLPRSSGGVGRRPR